jgi:hypothetical protein
VLIEAVQAGHNGALPDPALARAIAEGDCNVILDELGFDSLGWMEFCISIELATGQELTPAHIERMTRIIEIEDWLRAGVARG